MGLALISQLINHFSTDSQSNETHHDIPIPETILGAEGLVYGEGSEGNIEALDQAEKFLLKTIETDKENFEAYVLLGKVYSIKYHKHKQWNKKWAAKKMFEKAVQINPRSIKALSELADTYDYLKRKNEAIELNNRILEIEPHHLTTVVNKGKILLSMSKLDEAETAFINSLELAQQQGNHYEVRRSKELIGRVNVKKGKFDKAEKYLLEASEDLENYNMLWNMHYGCPYQALGELYYKKGDKEKGIQYYSKNADLEIIESDDQFNTAMKHYFAGNFERAIVYIERAQKNDDSFYYEAFKKFIKAQIEIANLLGFQRTGKKVASIDGLNEDRPKKFEAAIKNFNMVQIPEASKLIDELLLTEQREEFKILKGFVLLFQREYDKAKELFGSIHKTGQKSYGVRIGLGHLKIINKNYLGAQYLLEPSLRWLDGFFYAKSTDQIQLQSYEWLLFDMACLGLAWVYGNQNQHDHALTYYDKILEKEKENVLALLGKGNSLVLLDRLKPAEECFNKVLELQPHNQFALAGKAGVNLANKDHKEAERDYKRAISLGNGNYTCPYEGLGLLYLGQGKIEKAKKNFMKAIEINPNIEYKKYNEMAKILISEKKYERAQALLKQSIRNYPYDNEARNILDNMNRNIKK